jgi:hypothetical protein
VSILFFE